MANFRRILVFYFSPKGKRLYAHAYSQFFTLLPRKLEFSVTLWYEDTIVRLIVIDHLCFILILQLSQHPFLLKDKMGNNKSDSDT